jgi:hypothetical protein
MKLNPLNDFLYAAWVEKDTEPQQQLAQDLVDCDVNLAKLRSEVSDMIGLAVRTTRLSWIEKARVKQADFERKARELVQGILAGQMGPELQTQAAVFFRNRKSSEISEEELQSFLQDCQILDLI